MYILRKITKHILPSILLIFSLFSFNASAEEIGNEILPVSIQEIEEINLLETREIPSNNAEREALAARCNTDYGYQDLVNNVQNQAMIDLYNAIDESQAAFFASDGDLSIQDNVCISGSVVIPGDLTGDQIAQVVAVYRMDHPLYYWISSEVSYYGTTVYIMCYEEYALGQTRKDLYESILASLNSFEEYTEGSNNPYTIATASLYKLAQIVDYAYDASGEPESSAWAHNIIGVVDENYREVVCEGYAKFYQMLMNYFGVPNVYVVGRANGNTDNSGEVVLHAWNLVQMDDGNYYWTDPTWSDVDMRADYDYDVLEIENLNTQEDFPYRVHYEEHLIGDAFYEDHWPLTSDNIGSWYLYKLPDTSAEQYTPNIVGEPAIEHLAKHLANGGFISDIPADDTIHTETEDYRFGVVQNDGVHRYVEICGCYSSSPNAEIPSEIEYNGVTYQVIGVSISDIHWDVESINISEGIRYITGSFGMDLAALKRINIPSTIEFISTTTLSNTHLEEINVSESNPYIKSIDGVLYSKDGTTLIRYPLAASRKSFVVPAAVTAIHHEAFRWNKYLEELNLSEGLASIGEMAFGEMEALESLHIPETVSSLGGDILGDNHVTKSIHISANTMFDWTTFQHATALENVEIEDGNPCGYVYDGAVYVGSKLCYYPGGRKAESVTVKEDCTLIYPYAFSNGQALIGTVIIPDNCKVDPAAFFRSKVMSLTVSDNNSSIFYRDGAIYSPDQTILKVYLAGCKNKNFTVPDTVELIEQYAFAGNPYIESILMSDSVTDIRAFAFNDCTALKNIRLSDSIVWTTDIINQFHFYRGIFDGCTSLEEITLPKAATHVPYYMFHMCTNLKKVVLHENIQTMGEGVFYASALEELYIYNEDIQPISGRKWDQWEGEWFVYPYGTSEESENSGKIRTIVYGHPNASFVDYMRHEENWRLIFRDINTNVNDLPSSGQCGDNAFWNISDNVLTISGSGEMNHYIDGGQEAPWLWRWGDTIQKVVIEDSINNIGDGAFYGCTALEEIIIPESVTSIGKMAFTGCKKLKTIQLPKALQIIGQSAFNSCENLQIIELPEGIELRSAAFNRCNSLTEITLPKGATGIYEVFTNCDNLTEIRVETSASPDNIPTFSGCKNIKKIYMPHDARNEQIYYLLADGLINCIEQPTIYGCAGTYVESCCAEFGYTFVDVHGTPNCVYGELKEPELKEPESIPETDNMFWILNDEGILTISGTGDMPDYSTEHRPPWFPLCLDDVHGLIIEDGINSIGNYAFADCHKLISIALPESVTHIGSSAFSGCTSLTSIQIPKGVTSIGDHTFNSCLSLTSVVIHEGVTNIGDAAFYDCLNLSDIYFEGTKTKWDALRTGEFNDSLTNATIHYRKTLPSEPTTPPAEDDKPMENPFADVFEADYYYDPVLWAVNEGITNGLSADIFGPDATCTRAQIVTFLWRANGSPAPAAQSNPFTDVPAGQWYTDAVLWAVEKGITTGTSATTFSPDAGCTRGQVATFLWRSQGQPAVSGENIFTDIASGAYYYDAVLWAVANNITNGMGDGTFAPDTTCTRGQIVTFLYRAMA